MAGHRSLQERAPSDVVVSDAVIADAAANALAWYRAVPRGTVQVSVRDGWVTLSGSVGRPSERGAAERAVRQLRGVRGVSNAITVSGEPESAGSWRP